MAVRDLTKFFAGLNTTGPVLPTPNTVSRNLRTGDRAFESVVGESGKPYLDSEVNLGQDASWWENFLLRRWQVPSGWLRGQSRSDAYADYTTVTAPPGLVDNTPGGGGWSIGGSIGSIGGSIGSIGGGPDSAGINPDGTLINAFVLPRLEAVVAGHPVIVEYTNTETTGYNLITLDPPRVYDGTSNTVKRTDFVFLEVWRALVAPSVRSSAYVQIVDASSLVAGDLITINGVNLTASLASPAPANSYTIIPGNNTLTAANIAEAINLSTNSFDAMVIARAYNDTVILTAVLPGVGSAGVPNTGNFITLSVTNAVVGSTVPSGPLFTGGADRPCKPYSAQDQLYRHGNVLSPSPTWLPDELVDPALVNTESTQRIQIQYRIRVTGTNENVNPKIHPDGFSNLVGAPPAPAIFAQGSGPTPVFGVRSYPFVPADNSTTWLDSSAPAYGIEDDGLFIAGDGTEQAAEDLGTVDGFVYAIPICFVHRHNDASDATAAIQGFDPLNNMNGAPTYTHGGYLGVLGLIPAGVSDRPDGEFCDVITQNSLLDLRRHVTFPGVEVSSELTYQIQSLLDGSLRTWSVDSASKYPTMGNGSGDVSTRFLICNEIGRADPEGAPNISGTTTRGEFIRNFDHIARRFGDQSVIERVVIAYLPTDEQGSIGDPLSGKWVEKNPADPFRWYQGDILHLDLDEMDATTLGALFQGGYNILTGSSGTGLADPSVGHFAPPNSVVTDVLSIYHDDGHYTTAVDQRVEATLIEGLGTRHLTVTLDANRRVVNGGDSGNSNYYMTGYTDSGGTPNTDGSPRRIFLEVEITYPMGVGTTDTPNFPVTPDSVLYDGTTGLGEGPVIESTAGTLGPSQRPGDFEKLLAPRFRSGYREVQLEYVANDTRAVAGPFEAGQPVGAVTPEYLVSRNQLNLYFPRRVYSEAGSIGSVGWTGLTRVVDMVDSFDRPVDEPNTEFGSSSRHVVLTTPLSGTGQTLTRIEYFAQDAIPNYGVLGGGYQVAVYYRASAPQTAGVKEGTITTTTGGTLPTVLQVEPLAIGNPWTGQVGMGSVDLAYPYEAPLEQIPVLDATVTTQEWFFCASANVSVGDFDAATGLLHLHPFVQGDIQNVLTLGGPAVGQPPTKDAEFRALYPYADANAYRPTTMSQPLSGAVRHKVFFPMLVRATEDSPGVSGGLLFRRNELLLVVVTRFAELDEDNTVRFTDVDNRTCAAVYRTRNLLLIAGPKGS
jgi:hypothetical protein